MNSPTPFDIAQIKRLRQEAADWFVIIHADDDPSAETLQAWLRWLEVDERNRMAFEGVVQAWHSTPTSPAPIMPTADELGEDTYSADLSVAEWLAQQPAATVAPVRERGITAHRRSIRPRGWAWPVAASIVAAALGLIAMNLYLSSASSPPDTFSTKTGEQIDITLADGSHVWLGPKSTLLVRFTKARRGVELATGEAFFSVKKDHSRPFVVGSSSGDITAVGTAFNVRALSDHVTVVVSEGVVTVAPETPSSLAKAPTVRVASGQQLSFTAREPIESLAVTQSATLGERSRWRDGVLIYRDEPLRDVVTDVARYSDKQLEISGAAVGDLRFSGVVYKGAIEEWAAALPESFPVRLVYEGNREIILAR